MGIQANPAFAEAIKHTKDFERYAKQQIVLHLSKRTGQSAQAVVKALNNPKYKNSWLGLYKVTKDKDCYKSDYFGCACKGDPINGCPQRGAFYDVTWDTDRETGVLIGFKLGARICPKYNAAKQAEINDTNSTRNYSKETLNDDIDSLF